MYGWHHDGVEWFWMIAPMKAWLVLIGLVAYFVVKVILEGDRRPTFKHGR